MSALFRHLKTLRENFQHIGVAVNAAREFSRVTSRSIDVEQNKNGIPL